MRYYELTETTDWDEHDRKLAAHNKAYDERRAKYFDPNASKATIIDYIDNELFNIDTLGEPTNPERIKKRKIFHSFAKKIPTRTIEKMFKTLSNWSTSGYARLNNALRAGNNPPSAQTMDLYIEHAPKYKKDVAYRGLDGPFFKTLKTGKTFVDKGYSALSFNSESAEYFATRKTKGGILEVRGIANTAAIIPAAIWDESEILLPRGSKFKVISISPDGGRGSPVQRAIVQLI